MSAASIVLPASFVIFRGRFGPRRGFCFLTQSFEYENLPCPQPRRLGRYAAPAGAGRHVVLDAAQRSNLRPCANGHVIVDPGACAEHHEIFQHRAPGNPGLSYQQAVAANRDIVANLDEIVDLGPFANHGVLDGSAIDGAVGADFHVVLDDDPTDLRDLAGTIRARDKPESVLSDRTTRMHDHAIANQSMGYRSIGTDCTIAADANAGPDDSARTNERAGAYFGAG